MKNVLLFVPLGLLMLGVSCNQPVQQTAGQEIQVPDTTDATNDFYDNVETHELPMTSIIVDGETSESFTIDLTALPMRSVIVKEAAWTEDGTEFIGAYRYDGPSLYDILNECPLVKKNADEFNPIIDMYVTVENASGEKVVLSWGELFYPIHRHEIILATRVMHIVPVKTKDLWPLPESAKLIVGADLVTERNISAPTRITIHSIDQRFAVNRDLDPLYSESFVVCRGMEELFTVNAAPEAPALTYPNIFYGRGRGIHGVTPFTGWLLKDMLAASFPMTAQAIKTGMFTVSAADGYRAAFTYSELMNRNDQSEVLLLDQAAEHGGRFVLYPAADFFSDRSVMAMTGIWYNEL